MNNALSIVEYVRENGDCPYRNWFDSLHVQSAAKVATGVLRLGMGNLSRVKWIGTIGELRIDWGPGYRVYLAKDGAVLIVLLGGGTKQRQQADIKRANAMWDEYKSRKAKGKR